MLKKICLHKIHRKHCRGSGAGKELCNEMEAVKKITHLGDRVHPGGGCEITVTARTKSWHAKFRDVASCYTERGFL